MPFPRVQGGRGIIVMRMPLLPRAFPPTRRPKSRLPPFPLVQRRPRASPTVQRCPRQKLDAMGMNWTRQEQRASCGAWAGELQRPCTPRAKDRDWTRYHWDQGPWTRDQWIGAHRPMGSQGQAGGGPGQGQTRGYIWAATFIGQPRGFIWATEGALFEKLGGYRWASTLFGQPKRLYLGSP